ncbi:MAG: hypothetical protein DRJ18_01930 [Candidatus Methanomethylicota archaeon]|nr:MAG: hypothetical protein DRJ18_01930 [Candidatus Verstraetearchaeota archaeon]
MSHWTSAKIRIKNPDRELLKLALQAIAKELGVQTVAENYMVIGYNGRQRCPFAIPLKLPYGNGYGVYIDENGEVRVVVDDHGAPLSAREFANKLTQYYTTLAVQVAAQQLGFIVTDARQTPQGIVLDLTR